MKYTNLYRCGTEAEPAPAQVRNCNTRNDSVADATDGVAHRWRGHRWRQKDVSQLLLSHAADENYCVSSKFAYIKEK